MDARNTITFLLHDVSRHIRYRFDARARDLGVTRSQWRALLYLNMIEGPTQSELADTLEVERITLCRMIDRLAEAGLVERRADPLDRRVWRLHLTEAARGVVEKLARIGTELEEEALSYIAPAERAMLRETLTRMRDGLSRRNAEDRGGNGSSGRVA